MPNIKERGIMITRKVARKSCVLAVAALLSAVGSAQALSVLDDPLHGFCWGASGTCTDNGTITPTSANPLNFGFWASPAATPQTGNLFIDVLVPTNLVTFPALISYSITGDAVGTASLFSLTAWTGTPGDLADYLNMPNSSPANSFGGKLTPAQTIDPLATGFYVYQANLGTQTLGNATGTGPLLSIDTLIAGSIITAFLVQSTPGEPCTGHGANEVCTGPPVFNTIATAASGAILETNLGKGDEGGGSTPLPAAVWLFGTVLAGGAGFGRWRKKRKAQLAA